MAKTKAMRCAWSSCLLSHFLAVTFHLHHGWTWAGKGVGTLLYDYLKGYLSTSSLWNRSPNTRQDGIHTPVFLSLSLFFLINSLELPGAVGCHRADRSHFRLVLALKGGERDEWVSSAQSYPLPATWGWRHQGLLSLNLLGLCHPAHPNSHLQGWLWMPRQGTGKGKEEK